MQIDPASSAPVLTYLGGRRPRHVPARDLSGVDLARIGYHRAAAALRRARTNIVVPGAERAKPSRPGPADTDTLEAIATELISSGVFGKAASG